MKRAIRLHLRSKQTMDGVQDSQEQRLLGDYIEREGSLFLSYVEQADSGLEGVRTVLRLSPGQPVAINRYGDYPSQLLIASGKRYRCDYRTPYGALTLEVLGRKQRLEQNPQGGCLHLSYQLELGGGAVSDNDIRLSWVWAGEERPD